MKNRGYWGIALLEPKFIENLGTILRTAHAFGASFVCVIGHRYGKDYTNTTKAERHVPVFNFETMDEFLNSKPVEAEIVVLEVGAEKVLGKNYEHPERVIYLIGGEDRTVPDLGLTRVSIDTKYCLNQAVAASILMYDRRTS